jgi:hypothetical protein
MTSGVVVNSRQEFSRQQDIVLSDTMRAAPFLAAGDLGVHPVELVDGVIEVKSTATSQTVAEAVENIASVKRLASYEMRDFTRVVGSGSVLIAIVRIGCKPRNESRGHDGDRSDRLLLIPGPRRRPHDSKSRQPCHARREPLSRWHLADPPRIAR